MREIVNGLLLQGESILLAHRSSARSSYPDTWSFPGGHVDDGETLQEALVRELDEEIGVLPTSWRQLNGFTYKTGEANFHFFAVDHWQGNLSNLGDEHSELRWVNLGVAHEMPKLTFPIYTNIFAALIQS